MSRRFGRNPLVGGPHEPTARESLESGLVLASHARTWVIQAPSASLLCPSYTLMALRSTHRDGVKGTPPAGPDIGCTRRANL